MHRQRLDQLGLALSVNEQALVACIRHAAAIGRQLRIVGGGHARMFGGLWYDAEPASAEPIDVRLHADPLHATSLSTDEHGVVRLLASAGRTLGECRDFLKPYGKRLRGTPEAATITVGGACAMGSHGGGAAWYCFAAYVDEFWLVDGRARVHHLRRDVGDGAFRDLLVAHGLCGILLRVRVRVFDAVRQVQTYDVLPSVPDDLAQRIRQGAQWPELHSITFGPYTKRALVRQDADTDAALPSCWTDLPWRAFGAVTSNNAIVTAVDWLMTAPLPSLQRTASEGLFQLPKRRVVGAYDYFVPLPSAPVVYDMAYAVRLDDVVPCYRAVQTVVDRYARRGVYVGYRFWMRVLRAHDGLPHSLAAVAATDDPCVVVFDVVISRRPQRAWQFARAIDAAFARFGARPHLGKTLVRTKRAATAYDWQALRTLKRRLDPDHVFVTPTFFAML